MVKAGKRGKTRSRSHRKKSGSAAAQGLTSSKSTFDKLLSRIRTDLENIPEVLALGEYCVHNRLEKKIVDVIVHLEKQYPLVDPEQRELYNRLLAFGYGHLDRFPEAENVVQRALFEQESGSMDLYYVLAYVKASLKEYDNVITACNQYLALWEDCSSNKTQPEDFTATVLHASQLCNFLGSACREKGQPAEAAEAFEQAIAYDHGNQLPYINLANVHFENNERSKALEVIDRGLKNCRQVQELRMLRETFQIRVTVSACMIVKNEEELLPGCLDSIRNWVDEIVVVDTGSEDRTVEIAREYGARIFHQQWEGDFSKHRNYSIEQATCDWVFIIDADERFESDGLKCIRPLLNSPGCKVISIDVYNVYGKKQDGETFLPSIRFFRRKMNLRYGGIVHNLLQLPSDQEIHRVGARINHLGYDLSPEKMEAKFERSRELLKKQLEENSNNSFALFNYAQLLSGHRQGDLTRYAKEILDMASRAVDLTDPENRNERHIHLMSLSHLAWTNYFIGEYDLAMEYCERSLKHKSNFLDTLLLRGHITNQQEKYEEAEKYYQEYLNKQSRYDASSETDNMIIHHVNSRERALFGLGVASEKMGQMDHARKYYRQCLEIDTTLSDVNVRLGIRLMLEGELEEAEQCLNRFVEKGEYNREVWMGLGYLTTKRGDPRRARECYQAVLEDNPDDMMALIRCGKVCLEVGDVSEASQLFLHAAGLEQTRVSTLVEMAAMLFEVEQYHDAIEIYMTIPENERESQILNDLGNCYFRLQQFKEAANYYKAAFQVNPVAPEVYRNLGLTEARLGQYSKAVETLETYVEQNPQQVDILHVIADLRSQQGDYQVALPCYEKLLSSDPHDAQLLYKLSECYLHMGHRDSAIMGYRRVLQVDPHFKPAHQRLEELAGIVEKI